MTTVVQYVGHGCDDQAEQLDRLFDALTRYTLDPVFEKYGAFLDAAEPDVIAAYERAHGKTFDVPRTMHAFGNFYDYSCVFNLYTDDPDLIARLTVAIRENRSREAYRRAKEERRELARYWKQREKEQRRAARR